MRQDFLEQQEQEANDMIAALQQQQSDAVVDPEPPAPPVEQPAADDAVPPAPLTMPDDFDPYLKQGEDAEPQPEKPEDFEHKYKVLQGMYNREVTEVKRENKRLTEDNARLNGIVEELRRQPAAPAPEDAQGEVDVSAYSEYGPEIMELAKQNAVLQRELAAVRSQVQHEVQRVQGEFQKRAEVEFMVDMDRMLPSWRAQNQDQAFIDWLQFLCPGTGRPWQASLSEAYEAKDAARVTAIFKEYRHYLFRQQADRGMIPAGQAAPPPQGRAKPTPAPASRGGAPVDAPKAKYTLDDWSRLHDEAARGKWNHDPEGYRQRESEIHAALFPRG